MADAETFRRLACALDGVTESSHHGHPDFRVGKRIFATLHPGDVDGMVKLLPEQQALFMRVDPAFRPAAGAWGRQGCTLVRLADVREDLLNDALLAAWGNLSPRHP